ncbi:Denticleless A [Grifola frondosa]|uniref:Denticleless A n=1 Tax=Grifola frondosa TaxID=5627 RepID=A0A1C7MH81_GRIFR|nr:Denticleless A [Grifola frondosa]
MLYSPNTSRPAFVNSTNVYATRTSSFTATSLDLKRPFPPESTEGRDRKRFKSGDPVTNDDAESRMDSDSDDEMEDIAAIRARARKRTVFAMRNAAMQAIPTSISQQPSMSTRSILQSFVSSHKADIFRCHSIDNRTFSTLPYACTYSHYAKSGGTPLLAVATEQGTVHILNTTKRNDWDFEPQRVTLQPHINGVFDVKWSPDDTLLATASGDQSIHITSLASSPLLEDSTLHILRGHEGTVKGGKSQRRGWYNSPVIVMSAAHEPDIKPPKPKNRKGKLAVAAPLRSVTNLVYPDGDPFGLVSSGSSDGILHLWDLRLPTSTYRKAKKVSKALPKAIYTSSSDPTTYHGTHGRAASRPSHPAAALPRACSTRHSAHDGVDPWAHTHAQMQTNSFYVHLASSPCGRWLASGSAGDGRAFLFDVASTASAGRAKEGYNWGELEGVELRGQTGEVGALDWADGMLATCADDGTVRVWRPDVDVYRECEKDEKEMRAKPCGHL